MKIIINKCFGGFGLSPLAKKMILNRKGYDCFFYKQEYDKDDNYVYSYINEESVNKKSLFIYCATKYLGEKVSSGEFYDFYYEDQLRIDPDVIAVVEEIGSEAASSSSAELKIIEIPDDVEWVIEDYDGIETVHEKHRVWGE